MRKLSVLFIVVFVLSLTFGSAFAATYPHKEGKVEITIPDTWKVTTEGNNMRVEAKGEEGKADDDIAMDIELVSADNLEKSLDETDKLITKQLGEIVSEKTGEVELNGMKTYIEDFKTKDGKYEVSVALILTPAQKFLCLYYYANPQASAKYEKDVQAILQSIKPLKEAEGFEKK